MKVWCVGEKPVSLALGGLAEGWLVVLLVEIGVRPRRGAPLFHTLPCDGCGRVPGAPELAGLSVLEGDAVGGLWAEEGERWLIETARTLDWSSAYVGVARAQ